MTGTDTRPRSTPLGYAHAEPTQPPNWHGLVVWDVFLNAVATGLFLVTAAGELAAPATFAPVADWVYPVALVVLLADLACLVLDLGDPLRFHHMLRVFKPSSPMSLGTWCLSAYSFPLTALAAVVVLTAAGVLPGDSSVVGWVRTGLIVAALPFAFGSAAYKGVLFSTTSQPGWRDARWLGAYHVSSAVAVGCAVLVAAAVLTSHAGAFAVARLALVVTLVGQAIPLGLMIRELWPALSNRGEAARMAVAGAAGVVVPIAVLFVGAAAGAIVSTAVVLAANWYVRSLIVHLPQQHAH